MPYEQPTLVMTHVVLHISLAIVPLTVHRYTHNRHKCIWDLFIDRHHIHSVIMKTMICHFHLLQKNWFHRRSIGTGDQTMQVMLTGSCLARFLGTRLPCRIFQVSWRRGLPQGEKANAVEFPTGLTDLLGSLHLLKLKRMLSIACQDNWNLLNWSAQKVTIDRRRESKNSELLWTFKMFLKTVYI